MWTSKPVRSGSQRCFLIRRIFCVQVGLSASGSPFAKLQGALLVPQRAVNELQTSYEVAVVGGDNKVEKRSVTVGERIGSLWVIEDGLKPGDRVIVEGMQKVRDGQTVKPMPWTSSTLTKAQ